MKYWRMAMKVGNQGTSMWKTCNHLEIAAITYYPVSNIDFNKFSISALPKEWYELQPTQKSSLKRFIYEMKPGDIIYVKEGKSIVSKGEVTSEYFYDYEKRIIDENNFPWPNQRIVKWDELFPEIKILLGSEQHTVYPLSQKNVEDIEKLAQVVSKKECAKIEREFFIEGERFNAEQEFKTRNALLIKRKKLLSNYTCEICGFHFGKFYGEIGDSFIEAHHLTMISSGKKINTLDDVALVCSNCHSIIHKKNPPYSIDEMKIMINKK